ncbi:MAG: HEAT repeat domain-containing protein [Salinivirgaceae bacterium]|nr:HEAT repeat domain-containing protein [Salinivirgaceae bacterium]
MQQLLKSKIGTERTLGARLLGNSKDEKAVNLLIQALKVEKKLYPKIEICKSLEKMGAPAIKALIKLLGEIGNNQHESIPEKTFSKNNYPLPRDIAARTLIRFEENIIPELLPILSTKKESQLSEAIDTIGFICFYKPQPEVFEPLKNCMLANLNSEIICWKSVRAMSGFPESEAFLTEQKQEFTNPALLKEIDRSLELIKNNLNNKE